MGKRKRGSRGKRVASFDVWGNDPRAQVHRVEASLPLVACRFEYEREVMEELAALAGSAWGGQFMLLSFNASRMPGYVMVGVYGLTEGQCDVLVGFALRHHRRDVWGVEALAAEEASTDRPEAPVRA